MPLQNLEQIRAKNALTFSQSPVEKRGKDGGEAIKKIPPMIAGNGLLAAIAFSLETKFNKKTRLDELQKPGFAAIFDAIAVHLSCSDIEIVTNCRNANDLINTLTESNSETLKLATAEALEWLSYARRFV